MRASDKAEARAIAGYWRDNFTYAPEDVPATASFEGAAAVAQMHASLELAKQMQRIGEALDSIATTLTLALRKPPEPPVA